MIIDSRSLPDDTAIETDICIVGAGVAGIVIAREFIGTNIRVGLLESGSLEPDRITQSLYWGQNVGYKYYSLDTARARFFGGTSNCWNIPLGNGHVGVRLRPLDSFDFEVRDWIPYSGWPFNKDHLDPFYQRAQKICRLGPFNYSVKAWESHDSTELPFITDRVKTKIFQFATRDIFCKKYRNEIIHSDNITSFINANVIEIISNKPATKVTLLNVATLEGKKFNVSAKLFVLALGGIETPRLMLLSNKVQKTGLGNQNDLVGRFFMEHPHFGSGYFIPANYDSSKFRNLHNLYRLHIKNDIPIMGKLALSEKVLKREKLLNYCVSLHPALEPDPRYKYLDSRGVNSIHTLIWYYNHRMLPDKLAGHFFNIFSDVKNVFTFLTRSKRRGIFHLHHMSEQAPNPDSRITLSDERDALGQFRVKLNWQLSNIDIRTIIQAQIIIDNEIRRSGLGMLYIDRTMNENILPPNIDGGFHHMGTTRMHSDPKKGVVNKHCRVHHISNLFIAGSSVFPTGGCSNPTLTIIALSLKVADYIKKVWFHDG
jgi:choline dehydrogenase-like flavoprotein